MAKTLSDVYFQLFVRQYNRPGFNPRSSHTKDSKMVLDISLLKSRHKVRIKGKMEQSKEKSSTLPYTSVS